MNTITNDDDSTIMSVTVIKNIFNPKGKMLLSF